MSIQSINPTTEEVIETFEPHTNAQVNQALDEAHNAFLRWRNTTFAERGAVLHRVATYLREHKAELARLATLEMGKPIVESEAEVEKCAWNCDFYADNAEKFLTDERVATNAKESYVSFLPLGVVLALMPWNFPYWQVFRFAAPALMAGNTIVLKHASNVSLTALKLERIFQECGLPEGAFRTVLVPGAETRRIIEDPRIAAVTLTGSDAAGVSVASTSGHALKKTVLELGGSDAFIVLEDADLELTTALGRLFHLSLEQQLEAFLLYEFGYRLFHHIKRKGGSLRRKLVAKQRGVEMPKSMGMGTPIDDRPPLLPTRRALHLNSGDTYDWVVNNYTPRPYPGKAVLLWTRDYLVNKNQWIALTDPEETEHALIAGTHITCRTRRLDSLSEHLCACLEKAQEYVSLSEQH